MHNLNLNVADIRMAFMHLKSQHPNGNAPGGMFELIGTSFIADEETIFGQPDGDYIERELLWYASRSLRIDDIPGKIPQIWKDIASVHGEVNSNYGYLLHSEENGSQFDHVLEKLRTQPDTRQAVAIYTRPSMHTDATRDGMRDFVCTNAVNYFIREGKLEAVVQMRSNDVVFGYRNDYAWQSAVQTRLAVELGVVSGPITWQAASLHVYPRHHHLIPA